MKKKYFILIATFIIFGTFFSFIFLKSNHYQATQRYPSSTSGRVTPNFQYDYEDGNNGFILNVLNQAELNTIENEGYSFHQLLEGQGSASSNEELYNLNPYYRALVKSVGDLDLTDKDGQLPKDLTNAIGDIPELVKALRGTEDKGKRSSADPVGAYKIRQVSNNASHPYLVEREGDEPRHFDHRWLKSKFGHFKLIAVVNRIDKKDFDQSNESCGELRFIYRLSYKTQGVGSSMPFFLNTVYQYPSNKDCAEYAELWRGPQKNLSPSEMAQFLLRSGGPLDKSQIQFKQLEVNYQSLRFTSGYMKDFGGQAMYILKIFKMNNGTLSPIDLENTPDVLKVENSPQLFNQLIQFLAQEDNLQKLDQGTLVLPNFEEKFLSQKALSFSTLGRARTANKPYTKIFNNPTRMAELKKQITPEAYKNLKYIKTPEALIERLDNMTCMGCHQSGGTAGFHMLGQAADEYSHHFNKQELPLSAHAYSEISRRSAYLKALSSSQKVNSFRPHSNFPSAEWPETIGEENYVVPKFDSLKVRDLCVSNGAHFAGQPTCQSSGAPHYKTGCSQTVTNSKVGVVFGECVIHREGESKRLFSGHVCRKGAIVEASSGLNSKEYNFYSFMDKFSQSSEDVYPNFGDYSCGQPRGGTPLGRLSRRCSVDEEHFNAYDVLTPDGKSFSLKNLSSNFIPPEVCANRGGEGFDNCAASNGAGSCLEKIVRRDVLDTCYPGHFCREDFICQKIPNYHAIENKFYQRTSSAGQKHNQGDSSKINLAALKALHNNNIGFCTPTYFLFNMRVDGHPDPVSGKPWPLKMNPKAPLRGY